jgi:regulator of cell morphogenesis and NO signaling
MITCEDCGKMNDGKELGSNWICEDCKEGSQIILDIPIKPIGMDNHPYSQFSTAIDRLEEEHRVLEFSLLELCTIVEGIDHNKKITNWTQTMEDLKRKVFEFKQVLMVHSSWEEEELFKLVDYFDEIPYLFELIEKEHELAEQFMDAFITVIDHNNSIRNPLDAKKMSTYLKLALISLLGHFKKEEDIVNSLADFSNQYVY